MKMALLRAEQIEVPSWYKVPTLTGPISLLLAQSLKDEGVVNPITVAKVGERYILLDGLKRIRLSPDGTKFPSYVVHATLKEAAEDYYFRHTR